MKKIRVMCTSTGCLEYAPERYKKLGIDIIRIRLVFEGKEYLEGDVKGNLPTTAVPTYEEVAKHFQKAIDDGIEEVFIIAIDSYLGGTYNFINLVAKEFEEKLKITVIDSKICSLPEGFLAAKAVEFFEKGYKTEDVVKEINWMIRHQEFIGVVQKLDYLIYNGRLKGGKAYLGKLMGICPVLHFNRAGEIVALENKMGIRNALKRTMEIMPTSSGTVSLRTMSLPTSSRRPPHSTVWKRWRRRLALLPTTKRSSCRRSPAATLVPGLPVIPTRRFAVRTKTSTPKPQNQREKRKPSDIRGESDGFYDEPRGAPPSHLKGVKGDGSLNIV